MEGNGGIIVGIAIFINIVAIVIAFRLLSSIELKKRILIVILNVVVIFIISSILYGACSAGFDDRIIQSSKNIIMLAIVPINLICIGIPITLKLKKFGEKDYNKNKIYVEILTCIIIAIIVLILESSFITNSLEIAAHSLEELNN